MYAQSAIGDASETERMITLETVLAFAIRDVSIMDKLGEALRSDLVTANPYHRRVIEFADEFLLARRKLPSEGDYSVWLETLPEGGIRDGSREALGRLLAIDVSSYDPAFFSEAAIVQLRRGAAQVARARLNEAPIIEPEMLEEMARKMDAIQEAGLAGLAKLADVDIWAAATIEGERIPTGLPTLDKLVGGWGKELIIVFADSKVGKTMIMQNWAVSAALRGKRVLHITLELGLRPQILRYYRQIAQASKADMAVDLGAAKQNLKHWFRLAKGEVFLIELPAHQATHDDVRRMVERVSRVHGEVDVLVLDYLDLVSLPKGKSRRSTYEDLGVLTHELRDLCRAHDITVLTASQAVRRPQDKERLTIKDMGDSYNKVRGCDMLLSLVQTEAEAEAHQGRLGVLAVRDSGGRGAEVPLYINRELSVIAELSHPNTEQLMRRLGHLPSQMVVPQGLVP
jgi:Mrp family chromosome partitioning ATPase